MVGSGDLRVLGLHSEGGGATVSPQEWLDSSRHRRSAPGPTPRSASSIPTAPEAAVGETRSSLGCSHGALDFDYHKSGDRRRRHPQARRLLHRGRHRPRRRGGIPLPPRPVEGDIIITGRCQRATLPRWRPCCHQHAAVDDVAVFGIPDPEWGEQIKAVDPTPRRRRRRAWRWARVLPRASGGIQGAAGSSLRPTSYPVIPNGKLYKRQLRDPVLDGPGVGVNEAPVRGGAATRRGAVGAALLPRGVDEHDWDRVERCSRPDAYNDHGVYRGSPAGLVDYFRTHIVRVRRHAPRRRRSRHRTHRRGNAEGDVELSRAALAPRRQW